MGTMQTPNPSGSSGQKRKKILAVDDSKFHAILLQKTLGTEEYEVIAAQSGDEAIRRVMHDDPDLVLLDVMIADMDGYEICQKIKSYSASAEKFIPVILLTALDKVEDKVAGFEAGADEFLVKPLARNELLARVRSMLRIKDLQESLLRINSELSHAQKTIERELRIVGEIQRSFVPTDFPRHPQLDLAAHYLPSYQAGGDYYDVIEVDKNHWGIVIADVTGHGASAAVVMAVTHVLMHSFVNTFKFPSTALKVVNEKLNIHLSSDHYVTMFYGVLNTENMRFVFSSAGHNPMYHYRASDGTVHEMKTQFGFPLRSFVNDDYDEEEIRVEPGDKIVLFTDGIVESLNQEREVYGEIRMTDVICQTGARSAQETIDALVGDWEAFRGDCVMRDDMSLLIVRRTP